jgi:hypothetical protein
MTTIDKNSLMVITGGMSCGPAGSGGSPQRKKKVDRGDGQYDKVRLTRNCVLQLHDGEMDDWVSPPGR